MSDNVARRGFLIGGLGGAALLAAGCTSNEPAASGPTSAAPAPAQASGGNDQPGTKVTIGFSAPAADHGWIAAIAKNAEATAKQYTDIDFKPVEPTNDINQQISAVETLIQAKVNALVILPNDGQQLNQVALQATEAGIPVVNLDRIFPDKLAYRTWVGGDNYGMGVAAGHYIGKQLKDKGVSNPVIVEIQGIATLPLTQDRSKGFADALKTYGFSVTAKQDAQFTVETGNEVATSLLQAHKKIDAMWNHDDDQGVGVLAAIKEASRNEFIMVGGAGSLNAMREIQSGNSVLKATVTYSPTMASSAIKLARLIAQGKGMSDLVENTVPQSITLASETITKENVEKYLALGFES
ncbi:Ribose ABC transporter, periplasmic ribose-binding protein RbsB (TC 3.A.1.2.1) [[Actinomadura] parvosata subsp. kistnae]|uniref:Sugar ABC transporter substrate-binding protein n=1 Tax=[Actinomadura] parvosata subsp. kistnae TaxID=1909395 RepID=A0A1V0AFX5_9ACTN|nr:ABC transporter substrate-binding protein [Nonomuraea sp. ATCC 55076]AQZ68992.1 sugar ABC transporter substrate-binding protein [Nonomuraea sp. ATCC 55076]SPL92449.1 Ribose ABC transporter, periplasmic ribose-binding protein RbsB (TC 3.A.1.2.1) [Actinomadura parvosata subsp. kistnae]